MNEIQSLKENLEQAKALLDKVYYYAIDHGDKELESLMSCADSCIGESLDKLMFTE
jgi:hypothetical protein